MNTVTAQSPNLSCSVHESGRVVAVESDCIWVETIRQSTCNSCSAQKGCGHGLLNKVASGRHHHVRVLLNDEHNELPYKINDNVVIAVPERALVMGALIVYLLPMLSLLAGALVVSQWWPGDVAAFLGALVGFVVGIAGVRFHALQTRADPTFQPVVIKHMPSGSEIIRSV